MCLVMLKIELKKLWKDLSVLENMEDSRSLSTEETVEVGRIRDELKKATLLEEIFWMQKFKVLCVREGEETGILNFSTV